MARPAVYEKLGIFYLGKQFDLETRTRLDVPVLYDSRDLVTHAVCVGMTGSGKTGLGIGLIEEAALDGIPVIAIDPKGDLPNLLLDPPADAAERWDAGLAEWDQDTARRERLRRAADVRVLTPGSRAGVPLAVLRSLAPPHRDDPEEAAARANAVAASLLALAGLDSIAPHDREQVFLATLLTGAWQGGHTPDLPALVRQVQRPPFDQIGVLDLETFYPARDRQELALRLNAVLAAPGFDVWLSGEPLDAATLLHGPTGRPRVSVISIAHLPDRERMLVVSLVLSAVLEWTRRQSGSPSLRALIYMDEVFGYLPPTASPASKAPLLTLLKQARAFGVGVVLATQNPVDLDYKALSNAGTWFLGKLQTERDKARVLDGLEGAAPGLDRSALDRALSALPGRVFLMHNVHDAAPVIFETRWVLSYLKGPMTLEEIRGLRGADTEASAPPSADRTPERADLASAGRPSVPAAIQEYFMPGASGWTLQPVLYGAARVRYVDARRDIDVTLQLCATTPLVNGAVPADWERATIVDSTPDALLTVPPPQASFAELPAAALDSRRYPGWERDLKNWLERTQPLRLFSAPAYKLSSRPGEGERDFTVRVQQAVRERRDEAVEALRVKYAARIAKLEERLQRAQDTVAREQQQASQQKLQTALSVGATLLGALMGRKAVSASTLGRATTAARGVGRASKEAEDVTRAAGKVADVEAALQQLQDEADDEIARLTAELNQAPAIDTTAVKARSGNIDVQLVALAWSTPATTRTHLPSPRD